MFSAFVLPVEIAAVVAAVVGLAVVVAAVVGLAVVVAAVVGLAVVVAAVVGLAVVVAAVVGLAVVVAAVVGLALVVETDVGLVVVKELALVCVPDGWIVSVVITVSVSVADVASTVWSSEDATSVNSGDPLVISVVIDIDSSAED